MLILNRTGDEHVDEFEFDAWFRSHTATEQEHFLRDMQRAKLGHLVHWAAPLKLYVPFAQRTHS